MNKVTMQKYASYRQVASDVGKQIIELNEKCNTYNTFNTFLKMYYLIHTLIDFPFLTITDHYSVIFIFFQTDTSP